MATALENPSFCGLKSVLLALYFEYDALLGDVDLFDMIFCFKLTETYIAKCSSFWSQVAELPKSWAGKWVLGEVVIRGLDLE